MSSSVLNINKLVPGPESLVLCWDNIQVLYEHTCTMMNLHCDLLSSIKGYYLNFDKVDLFFVKNYAVHILSTKLCLVLVKLRNNSQHKTHC